MGTTPLPPPSHGGDLPPSPPALGDKALETSLLSNAQSVMARDRVPEKTARARELRKRMGDAEAVLWSALRRRQLGCRFRRQHPIGRFVVDFVCLRHRYVIELDGEQHLESPYDAARTRWLEQRGYRVIRFWNNEVLGNLEMVTDTIAGHAS